MNEIRMVQFTWKAKEAGSNVELIKEAVRNKNTDTTNLIQISINNHNQKINNESKDNDDIIDIDSISEEQYDYIKNHKDEDKALTGFVGFGCSFSGKWFGGYARDHNGRNYCKNAYNSIIKQSTAIKDVVFDCKDYKTLNPHDCLIYCDPPYKGTTKYTGVPDFDTTEFWEIMRRWSKNNNVYISEYSAPDDFHCVLEMLTKTDIRNSKNQNIKRIEKLFTYDTTKH